MTDVSMGQLETPVSLSVIVPMLDEHAVLPEIIGHLSAMQEQGHDVLLVDGGSTDGSVELAQSHGLRVIRSPPGRATQMNTGAQAALSTMLVFLHVDTQLPDAALELVRQALVKHEWGRFDVRIAGDSPMLGVIGFFMNRRSRYTGIATGDQAIFVRKAAFDAVGGFPDQPLMEDIELSIRLRRRSPPACLHAKVITSGRRWMQGGIWRTIWLMWCLRFAYWRGVPAQALARRYQ